ncbi:MAG: hypothetical protein ACI845_001037, partial [Gammaproteobacteria bacterium]
MVQVRFKLARHLKPRNLAFVAFIVATGIIQSATAATLYKWIDDDGQIRYSDQLPPLQVKKKHEKLNSQGVVIDTKEAAKTDEVLGAERKAAETAARIKAEADKIQA